MLKQYVNNQTFEIFPHARNAHTLAYQAMHKNKHTHFTPFDLFYIMTLYSNINLKQNISKIHSMTVWNETANEIRNAANIKSFILVYKRTICLI